MLNPINSVWTERYRPRKVSEVVGDFKDKITKYLDKQESIPHFLLHSKTPGTGKCVSGDTLMLTNNGLISFDEYVNNNNIVDERTDINETLFCPENNFVKTEYFYKGKSKTIKIKSTRGFSIEGTPEHKIKVFDINNGFVWKELKNIKKDELIPIFYNTEIYGDKNKFEYSEFNNLKKIHDTTSIMINKPKELNEDISFLLGVFVANGLFDNDSIRISTHKDWLQKRIIKILKEQFNVNGKVRNTRGYNEGVDTSSVWLGRFFNSICGVNKKTAREKTVPKIIFRTSKKNQLAFISGLLEDSWISKEGYIQYSTASEQLATEIKYILLNMGFFVTQKEKYLKKYKHTYYSLTFSVEHSRNLLTFFDMKYKNKNIVYDKKTNTNILSYSRILEYYVANRRKKYNIRKYDIIKNNLVPLKFLKGSFEKVNKNLSYLLKEKYLSETIKLFLNNNIFLDSVESIIKNKEKDIYDFHIPKTHSFLANGIINHNTTLAKTIINELGCDALILNSSDDRKIEVVRDKVKQFAITQSSKGNMRRCVFMDEFDGMLKASQDALRNVMETYASNVFFILTCNNINKVIEPIKSRCVVIPFAYPKKEEIYVYLEGICKKEDMDYTEDGLKKLIEINYPSIRNCVISLQDLYTEEKPVTEETVKPVNEIFETMWGYLEEKRWSDIKRYVMESTIDPRDLNTYFWERSLNSEQPDIKKIQITCRNERDIALGADPKVIFVTSLIEMVK